MNKIPFFLLALGVFIFAFQCFKIYSDSIEEEQYSKVQRRLLLTSNFTETPQEVIHGLNTDDKTEIVYAINQLKKKIHLNSNKKSSKFLGYGIPLINWDENLASEASIIGRNCPASGGSMLAKGIMVSTTIIKDQSLTEMVEKWLNNFTYFVENEENNDAHNQETGIVPYKEIIGCAKTVCEAKRKPVTSLVCVWKSSGNQLIKERRLRREI